MSTMFMRGKLDLSNPSIAYYLVGRLDGQYYIYQDAPTSSTEDKAVFASRAYTSDVSWKPRLVFISDKGNGAYSLRASIKFGGLVSNLTSITYKGSPTLEINDKGDPGTNIRLNTSFNAPGLWAGVWYTAKNINGTNIAWKTWTTESKAAPFGGVDAKDTVTPVNMEIMFIPQDAGGNPIAVWNSGACRYPTQSDDALNLFVGWVTNRPEQIMENCDGPGWLTSRSNNCIFTSGDACKQGYLYTMCTGDDKCGSCMGACSDNHKPCVYDYDPIHKKDSTTPLSCEPKYPKPPTFWQLYKTYIIVALVIGALLFIIGVIVVISLFSGRKKRSVTTTT